MLTLRDFIDYCGLTDAEVADIAQREHIPPILAAQIAAMNHDLARADRPGATPLQRFTPPEARPLDPRFSRQLIR